MRPADHETYHTSSPPPEWCYWPRKEVYHLVKLLYNDVAARDIVLPETYVHGSRADGRTDRSVYTAWAERLWGCGGDWQRVRAQVAWLRHVHHEGSLDMDNADKTLSEMDEGSMAYEDRVAQLAELPWWDMWVAIARDRVPRGDPKQIWTSGGCKWLQRDGTYGYTNPADEPWRRRHAPPPAPPAHRSAAASSSRGTAAASTNGGNVGASASRAGAAQPRRVLGSRSSNVGAPIEVLNDDDLASSNDGEEEADFTLVSVSNQGSPVKPSSGVSAGKRKATGPSEAEARALDAERRSALQRAAAQQEQHLQQRREALRLREQATERLRLQVLSEADQRRTALDE